MAHLFQVSFSIECLENESEQKTVLTIKKVSNQFGNHSSLCHKYYQNYNYWPKRLTF